MKNSLFNKENALGLSDGVLFSNDLIILHFKIQFQDYKQKPHWVNSI